MTVQELHSMAIEKADIAFLQKAMGHCSLSTESFKEAFQFEKQAAILAKEQNIGEPTISVLFKSAEFLAINANLIDEAEKN